MHRCTADLLPIADVDKVCDLTNEYVVIWEWDTGCLSSIFIQNEKLDTEDGQNAKTMLLRI